MRLLADWNHDGKIDPGPPRAADAFVVVPLLPDRADAPARFGAPLEARPASTEDAGPVEVVVTGPAAERLRLTSGDADAAAPVALAAGAPGGGRRGQVAVAPGETLRLRVGAVAGAGGAGRATLTLRRGGESASVRLRVAPVLLASSLDPVSEVLVVRNDLTRRFAEDLARLVPKAEGAPAVRFLDFAEVPHDVWMQDAVEIGVAAAPGPDGVRQTPVPLLGLRAKHHGIKTAPLDAFVARHFAADEGAIPVQAAEPRPGTRWIDWYGNLEVTPPLAGFPHGRVLTGRQKELDFHPGLMAFLEAQGVQWPPVVLDVSWLTIGHVDELVNFVPMPGRPGFRALLPSPALARDLLTDAVRRGHADAPVFAGKKGETNVRRLLGEVAESPETRAIEASLAETRRVLEKEMGIGERQVVPVPVLFKDGLPVIPNAVNSLVVGTHVFVPAPCGPVIDGADVFEKAIRDGLAPLGLTPHFLDIWEPYHVRSGEIHCGTNAVRRLRNPAWWQQDTR